jgi:hypothetical protein
MIKRIVILLCYFVLITNFVYSQKQKGRKFTYILEEDIYANDEKGIRKKICRINYSIDIFHVDSEYISITRPQYLDKYPKGEVIIYETTDKKGVFQLNTDSIQKIVYLNLNCRIVKQHIPMGSNGGMNYKSYLKDKYEQIYFYDKDSSIIEGLECRKFIAKGGNKITHQLWVNTEIQVDMNPITVFSPGLIVEATSVGEVYKKYTLISYDLNADIDKNIFLPKEFLAPFKVMK